MTDRFSARTLFCDHFKFLCKSHDSTSQFDYIAVILQVLIPLVTTVLMLLLGEIENIGFWFTGVSLLTTGLMASFTYLAGLRLRFTERERDFGSSDHWSRIHLDETIAHVLVGCYISAITSVILVVESILWSPIPGYAAFIPTFLTSYLMMLVVLIIPRLYDANLQANTSLKYVKKDKDS